MLNITGTIMLYLFRNREIEFGQTFKVYRNLNNSMFSIVATTGIFKNKVVAHADAICLNNVTFKISEPSRLRACKEKVRNVHAWAVGTIDNDLIPSAQLSAISYNPFFNNSFFYQSSLQTLQSTALLVLKKGKAFAA